jgi:pre-mRNA-splicing factor ATP-dependent RNA helicase DHX16
LKSNPLNFRSIQIGVKNDASEKYVEEWTVEITDITETAHEISELVKQGNLEEAHKMLPEEKIYPVSEELQLHLEMNVTDEK